MRTINGDDEREIRNEYGLEERRQQTPTHTARADRGRVEV